MSNPPHPADGMTSQLDVGDGAVMGLVDPRSFADGGLTWALAYWGDPTPLRHTAASVIGSYDYLLSDSITMKEATRRLRLLRAHRRELMAQTKEP